MKIKSILGLGVLLLTLSACSSMMYPEKTSSDDCLVIMPTEFVNESNSEPARSYFLGITGQEKKFKIPTRRFSTLYIKINSENDVIDTVTSRVTNPKYTGDDSIDNVNKPLPYSKGGLVISDYKIVQKIVRNKSNLYTSSYTFVELTDDEKKALMDEAMANENLFPWFQ